MTPRNYKKQTPGGISIWFIFLLIFAMALFAWKGSEVFKGTLQPNGFMSIGFN